MRTDGERAIKHRKMEVLAKESDKKKAAEKDKQRQRKDREGRETYVFSEVLKCPFVWKASVVPVL
jgi:hypothetical protein